MRRFHRAALKGLVAVALAGGCAAPYAERRDEPVVRRFGDRLVEGPYISPAAYEHYILAMLREAAGHPEEAAEELRRALGSDGTSSYLRVRLADVLLGTGRLDEAREELDAALRLEPDSAEAYIVKSRLYARLGDRHNVDVALERAIQLDPANEEAYVSLAASQRNAGHEDRAMKTMRLLASRLPSAAAEEALGRAALAQRDRRAAREHLRRALELDSSRNDARIEAARLALGDGEVEQGLQLLALAAERARDPGLSLELARAAAVSGRRVEALAILDRLEEDANMPQPRLDVAAAFIDVGVPHRAALIAEAVAVEDRRGPVHSAAVALKARALEAEGSVTDALAAWQSIVPTDPEYTDSILARTRLLRARGRDHEALGLFDTAIADRAAHGKLDERDRLSAGLAGLRSALGDREAAIAKIDELLAVRPRAQAVRLTLARLLRQAGQWTRAVALLEPDVRAGQVEAMHLLGDIYVEAGQHLDEAVRLLERAEGLAPHDPEVADSLGAAYLACGRLDDAERLLRRADRLAPPDVDVLLHLSHLWEKRDRRADAVVTLRRALEARPEERVRQEIEARILTLERGRVGAR